MKVFVYGTLRKGEGNHHILMNSACIEQEDEVESFTLYKVNPHYPAAVPRLIPGYSIKGEVYGIDEFTLERLDRLEGYPNLYDRVEVETKKGHRAIMYIWNGSPLNNIIESGDWRKR